MQKIIKSFMAHSLISTIQRQIISHHSPFIYEAENWMIKLIKYNQEELRTGTNFCAAIFWFHLIHLPIHLNPPLTRYIWAWEHDLQLTLAALQLLLSYHPFLYSTEPALQSERKAQAPFERGQTAVLSFPLELVESLPALELELHFWGGCI